MPVDVLIKFDFPKSGGIESIHKITAMYLSNTGLNKNTTCSFISTALKHRSTFTSLFKTELMSKHSLGYSKIINKQEIAFY